jgi:hypothetical protein
MSLSLNPIVILEFPPTIIFRLNPMILLLDPMISSIQSFSSSIRRPDPTIFLDTAQLHVRRDGPVLSKLHTHCISRRFRSIVFMSSRSCQIVALARHGTHHANQCRKPQQFGWLSLSLSVSSPEIPVSNSGPTQQLLSRGVTGMMRCVGTVEDHCSWPRFCRSKSSTSPSADRAQPTMQWQEYVFRSKD